jgi:hypothetical protein
MRAALPTFTDRLREIGMFFDGTDAVHQTMRRVAVSFENAGIAYCIVGGMAVNAHKYRRTTADVDFLLTADGFREFAGRLATTGFQRVKKHARKFCDPATGVTFDILVTGLFPGSGRPGPISFPDPSSVAERFDDLNVVDLPTLVELKLAARRYKDFGDVVDLIRQNGLDESFQDRLHETVRSDFIECLEEMRREDDYERRQDAAVDELRQVADSSE